MPKKKQSAASKRLARHDPTYKQLCFEALDDAASAGRFALSAASISLFISRFYPHKCDGNLIRGALKRAVNADELVKDGGMYLRPAHAAKRARASSKSSSKSPSKASSKASKKSPAKKAVETKAASVASPSTASKRAPAKRAPVAKKAVKAVAAKPKVFDTTTVAPEASHKWQYLDNNRGGWNDYDPAASDVVEAAYQEYLKNPGTDVRAVKSGEWQYQIDFHLSQQVNTQHSAHTRRDIRRTAR